MTDVYSQVARETAAKVAGAFVSRPLRTMRQFAEQEITIPDGPFAGRRFRCDRQPFTGLLFDAIDSGKWNRFVTTGPTQSGKTLASWVIPVLYHLFEIGEKVIVSAPKVETVADKWTEDLRPAIEASQNFRRFLPLKGQGSRDAAKLDKIRFTNGAVLKVMGGGGSDKNRAAFTSRVVVITETDGMDESGGTSREADKITQLEHRTDAYGERKRIYMECTVSTEEGRTWREYQNGTASKIILPCPKCGAWVTPERENLDGWRDAESQPDARQKSQFACPECGDAWTEPERVQANQGCRLLHRGQEVAPEGEIVGVPVPTETLGFRWSAANNLFRTAGDAGVIEWSGARAEDEENAEKELRQFVWAIPYDPPRMEMADLSEKAIASRCSDLPRGHVPDDRLCVTLGCDVGQYLLHWRATAWRSEGGGGQIIDYGEIEVPSRSMVADRAILMALRQLRDMAEAGWITPQKELVSIDRALVDAHWKTTVVKSFCAESGAKWCASIGFGRNEYHESNRTGTYGKDKRKGKSTGAIVQLVGERYHAAKLKGERHLTWEFDADYWKSKTHERFSCPTSDAAAVVLPKALTAMEHWGFAKHITAEKLVEEYVPGQGAVQKWERPYNRPNHLLDASVLDTIAGHIEGVRLVRNVDQPKRKLVLSALQKSSRR